MIRIVIAICCSMAFAAPAQTLTSQSSYPVTPSGTGLASAREAEEFIYSIYRKSYENGEASITDFETRFFDQVADPYPYIYALWFNEAVLGPYGKKDDAHQLQLIERILNDPDAQGTVKTSARYQKSMHHVFGNDIKAALEIQSRIVSLKSWQLVGPFENISRSGFHKDFGPLEHPEPNAEFVSASKAKVKWFIPAEECRDGWVATPFYFNKRTAVVYAQTFVNSPRQQDVYINLGSAGALKAWLNDALIFADETERITEFDAYTVKTTLQKGINRILIQLSFTDTDYPNFAVRLTDENHHDMPALTGSSTYKQYTKAKDASVLAVTHFAEDFFLKKIENEPDNAINYLLLSDVYQRNAKIAEARDVIETALVKHPDNPYLRRELIDIFSRENNRTRMLEELSKLRQLDPNSLLCLDVDINTDISNLHWEEAMQKIDKRLVTFGEDESIHLKKLDILAKQKKFQELINLAEELFRKYPNNAAFTRLMFSIKRDVHRDAAGAFKVYEDYLNENYNYDLLKDYSQLLITDGQTTKGTRLIEEIIENHPFESSVIANFANYHFSSKNYEKAEELMTRALALSPYHEGHWEKLGDIQRDQKKEKEAIEAYSKSLQFEPNQYQVINKLRLLRKQSESHNLVPPVDIDQVIQERPFLGTTSTDEGFVVLHDETTVILHPGGAQEEFNTYVVKTINEAGVKAFKESTINYSRNQTLLIELAEIVKPSGIRIRAERNENDLVFTNLEAGDVIVFKYSYKDFATGRFADEYWTKTYFAHSAPMSTKRFNILVPPGRKIHYKWNHLTMEPMVRNVEDFRQYTWEAKNIDGVSDEPYSPPMVDIAPVLHISTLNEWKEVADWYADISTQSSADIQDINAVIGDLFTEELTALSDFDKAKRIYEFILTNIRYSSVSFRQGAYVPQPAHLTLTTRLGDCKDLSNLFLRLCETVGIHGRMVLVDSHSNGEKDMLLPSVDFNHCIAKVRLDDKDYYVELTDRYLPFASLPNSIINSLILEIPRKGESLESKLTKLYPATKAKDVARTYLTIEPDENDVLVGVKTVKHGHLSSALRSNYAELSDEKLFKTIESKIASSYKNNVVLERVEPMLNLHELTDSASISYAFRVKDEVTEIGSIRAFKISYPDIIGMLSHFPSESRTYPLDYNAYEDTDDYITKVVITIPEGRKYVTLPENEKFTFQRMLYTVSFRSVSPRQLEVTRVFRSDRNTILATDYPAFKKFLEKIVKSELRMISYQ